MTIITINVDNKTYEKLKERASKNQRSLRKEVLFIIQKETEKDKNEQKETKRNNLTDEEIKAQIIHNI